MKTVKIITSPIALSCSFALALVATLAMPALGQLASSTSLTGTVTDTSGALVPRANVEAVNNATQVPYTGVTNASGIYDILYIPVGTYTITVNAQGFGTVVHNNIIVENNQTVRSDFELKVGSVQTSVTVSTTPPPIATDNATIGQTISLESIAQLPINGEDPLKLATLNSGVALYNTDNAQGNPPG
ncbi:MAG: carboxypeptidase-like regulatory domain-containing protein, partial [Terriglobia bacterium]